MPSSILNLLVNLVIFGACTFGPILLGSLVINESIKIISQKPRSLEKFANQITGRPTFPLRGSSRR